MPVCLLAAGCMSGGGSTRRVRRRPADQGRVHRAGRRDLRASSTRSSTRCRSRRRSTSSRRWPTAGEADRRGRASTQLRALDPPEELEEQVDAWLALNERTSRRSTSCARPPRAATRRRFSRSRHDAADNEKKADAAAAEDRPHRLRRDELAAVEARARASRGTRRRPRRSPRSAWRRPGAAPPVRAAPRACAGRRGVEQALRHRRSPWSAVAA